MVDIVVPFVEIGDARQPWAGDMGEWVEGYPVYSVGSKVDEIEDEAVDDECCYSIW
jgi:hypothetical protein